MSKGRARSRRCGPGRLKMRGKSLDVVVEDVAVADGAIENGLDSLLGACKETGDRNRDVSARLLRRSGDNATATYATSGAPGPRA